jgi:2'-5' RNA ligase
MSHTIKRLFFACETYAPWPSSLPSGRLLKETQRHVTLAFLGNIPFEPLQKLLPFFPIPLFFINAIGMFDCCLSLPARHPNVIAWGIQWFEDSAPLLHYQQTVVNWLRQQDVLTKDEKKPFLPHVTLCRSPFNLKEWKQQFTPLPFFLKDICLYESMGNLNYQPLWRLPMIAPFEELEHTADIAFLIRGTSYQSLYCHAQLALSFHFPPLLNYFSLLTHEPSLDEIIMQLNVLITQADSDIGCPFKAISFHDRVEKQNHWIEWEMIVDV